MDSTRHRDPSQGASGVDKWRDVCYIFNQEAEMPVKMMRGCMKTCAGPCAQIAPAGCYKAIPRHWEGPQYSCAERDGFQVIHCNRLGRLQTDIPREQASLRAIK